MDKTSDHVSVTHGLSNLNQQHEFLIPMKPCHSILTKHAECKEYFEFMVQGT